MKKLLIFILTGLFLPVFCFGATDFLRTPTGFYITSPVKVNVENLDESFVIDCLNDIPTKTHYWIGAIDGDNWFSGDECVLVATSTPSIHNITLPIGTYKYLAIHCGIETTCGTTQKEHKIEYDAGNPIFEIIPPPWFLSSNISSVINYITDLFDSIGAFVWLIIGIPLSFVVIKRIMLIIPK